MTQATLAGIPITNEQSVTWELTQGVAPCQKAFVFSAANASKVLSIGYGLAPLKLVIDREDGSDPVTVSGLRVIGTAPARAPYLVAVVVADARVLWSRELLGGAYNIRRRTGDRYLALGQKGLELLSIIPPNDDVRYAKFSLQRTPGKDGAPETLTPWTAQSMLEDVLKRVTINSGGYSMAGYDSSQALPVEGLTLDDNGPEGLSRALNYVPGLRIYLDYDGKAQFTSALGRGEIAQIKDPPIGGPDVITQVDLSNVRPSAVQVYFTVEQEIRFDAVQTSSNFVTAQKPSSNAVVDPRLMTNVLQLPDPVLHNYVDSVTGQTKDVYQGTWVPIDQNLFNAWNADTKTPFSVANGSVVMTLQPISFDLIHRSFFTAGGYTAYDEALFGGVGEPVWGRRFAALQQHYRQTYQLPSRWLDRVRSIEATRGSVIDYVNGTRAPAAVYQNYCAIPNIRRLARKVTDPGRQVGQNAQPFPVTSYVYGSLPSLTGLNPVSYALVDIIDQDQGVIHIRFNSDAFGDYTQFIPSLVQSTQRGGQAGQLLATWDPADQANAAAGGLGTGMLMLTPNHAASIVLNVTPASPNDATQYHMVNITPDLAQDCLPQNVDIGDCQGPVWKIHVGPGILKARFCWFDSQSASIEASIYSGVQRTGLMLINPFQILDYAKAVGASVYSAFLDRPQGTHVTALNSARLPTGRIERVVHELTSGGNALTLLSMPPEQRGAEVMSLIPESVRRQILGLVTPRI